MAAIRCTAKLLKKLKVTSPEEPPAPANALGDWFANIVYTRQGHYVILVSATSLLPVITTARGLDQLVPRFLGTLRDLLEALEVGPAAIDRELEATQPVCFARTNSRVVLGAMNDYVLNFKYLLGLREEHSLHDWMRELARTPFGPIGMESPDRLAPRLLRNPHGFEVIDGGRST